METIQITYFNDPTHQRQIEQSLNLDFCETKGGILGYENNRPYLFKKERKSPLAITHTKGVHLISESNIGLDAENHTRKIKLKDSWVPNSLKHLSPIQLFTLGESLIKLNFASLNEIFQTKLFKTTLNFTHPQLGKSHHGLVLHTNSQFITSHFFILKNFIICRSLIND